MRIYSQVGSILNKKHLTYANTYFWFPNYFAHRSAMFAADVVENIKRR